MSSLGSGHPRPRPLFFRFRAHLVKELKDLEQLKPQKLLSELTPLGIPPRVSFCLNAYKIESQRFRWKKQTFTEVMFLVLFQVMFMFPTVDKSSPFGENSLLCCRSLNHSKPKRLMR